MAGALVLQFWYSNSDCCVGPLPNIRHLTMRRVCAEYAQSMRQAWRQARTSGSKGSAWLRSWESGAHRNNERTFEEPWMEESLLYIWRLIGSSRIKLKSYFSLADTSMRRVWVNQANFSKVSFAESSMRQVCGNEKNERRRCQAAFCKKIVCGAQEVFF